MELFRFIDWILTLPSTLEQQFRVELAQFEAEVKMDYVTSVERLAMEEGRQEGRAEGRAENAREMLIDLLQVRFGTLASAILEDLNQIEDIDRLKALHREAVVVKSLSAFAKFLNDTDAS